MESQCNIYYPLKSHRLSYLLGQYLHFEIRGKLLRIGELLKPLKFKFVSVGEEWSRVLLKRQGRFGGDWAGVEMSTETETVAPPL